MTQSVRYNQFVNLVNLIPDSHLFKVSRNDRELYRVTRKNNECLYLIKNLKKTNGSVQRIQKLRNRSKSLLLIQDMLYQMEVEKRREDIFYQLLIESEDDLQKQLKIVSNFTKQYHLNKKRVDYIFVYPELKKEIDHIKSIISLSTSSFDYCQFDDIKDRMNHIFKHYPEKSLYHEVISFFYYQSIAYEKVAKRQQYFLIQTEREKVKSAYEMGGYYQGKFIDFDMTFHDDFTPYVSWLQTFKKEVRLFLELVEEKEFEPELNLLDYVEEICVDTNKYYRTQETIIFMDEAWFFNTTAVGRSIIKRIKRLGRSENSFLVLITQSVDDTVNEDDNTGFGTIFAFHSSAENEAEKALKPTKRYDCLV